LLRVILLGAPGVGKTALVQKFLSNSYANTFEFNAGTGNQSNFFMKI
jgi:GTPase SAR1 family protein